MTAEPFDRSKIPFNPAMLRWAREWRGRTIAEVAHKLGKKEGDIVAWEDPDARSAPTVRQARQLAEFYERPFLEFFGTAPPPIEPIAQAPDFRLYAKGTDPKSRREAMAVQLWAEGQRLNTLDLFEALGEEVPPFPAELLRASPDDNVEEVAERARAAIGFPILRQMNQPANRRDQLPSRLRAKFESSGILTLKSGDLKEANARGLALAIFPLPVIVVGTEAPTAQAFSLVHELGHIILRQSALSGPIPISREGGSPTARRTEEWCNSFAASFLIPRDALGIFFERPTTPTDSISDSLLNTISSLFGVSPHAMLIRLTHLRYVQPEYYWTIKRPQFVQQEKEYRSYARAPYYGSRYRSASGDLYTGLVLEAWSSGLISNHNAAEFMGIKNLKHLQDIREHFGSR